MSDYYVYWFMTDGYYLALKSLAKKFPQIFRHGHKHNLKHRIIIDREGERIFDTFNDVEIQLIKNNHIEYLRSLGVFDIYD